MTAKSRASRTPKEVAASRTPRPSGAPVCMQTGFVNTPLSNMPTRFQRARERAFIKQQGLCLYCDQPMATTDLQAFARHHKLTAAQAAQCQCTAEHLRPRAEGGRNSACNIVAACRWCNSHRHMRAVPPNSLAYREHVQLRLAQGKWFPWRRDGGKTSTTLLI